MIDAAETAADNKLWEDWDRPAPIPDSPVLHLAGFDGPMDLLPDLSERRRIDLGRISVLHLAEQFVAGAERLASHVPIERRAYWLVVATRLVLLRSRLLSTADPVGVASAGHDAARQAASLEGLVILRRAAKWLPARPQLGIEVFARPTGRSPRVSFYTALMESCLELLRSRVLCDVGGEAVLAFLVPAAPFRMEAALGRIRALFAAQETIAFPAYLPALPREVEGRERVARAAVASNFAAALELVRAGGGGGKVLVQQETALGAMHVRDLGPATEIGLKGPSSARRPSLGAPNGSAASPKRVTSSS